MFEMDVLRCSRSSYNPTVSFRVYAIRVCSTRHKELIDFWMISLSRL